MIEIAPKETEVIANWEEAKLYCFSLNTNNKTGWRLPTEEELIIIGRSKTILLLPTTGHPMYGMTSE
jgi:hypothetical protein